MSISIFLLKKYTRACVYEKVFVILQVIYVDTSNNNKNN